MILLKSFFKTVIFIFLFCFQIRKCSANEDIKLDIMPDIKTAFMYFSEPFLKGAKFNGVPLEGESSTTMAKQLAKAIEGVERFYPEVTDLEDLAEFKNQLIAGIPISERINTVIYGGRVGDDIEANPTIFPISFKIQEALINGLKEKDGLIIPIGWVGHALALVIKSGDNENTVDMAFVNTGEGIEYHYHAADPNGIYPALSQVWIEFKGVPNDKIFTQDAWFVQGLIMLRSEILEKALGEKSLSLGAIGKEMPNFFYGSFLANFKDHLVAPKAQKLIPMQRSGSCTLSSLIGALIFVSKSEQVFYLHQLKIGHAIISNLLDKLRNDSKFKEVISDGFGNNERHLFKTLASSIAQQTLKYLEAALPEFFKHSGLIGSERFKWVFEKKSVALEALMSNEVIYENIKTSVKLSLEIINFLNDNPISASSNEISIKQDARSSSNETGYDGDGYPCDPGAADEPDPFSCEPDPFSYDERKGNDNEDNSVNFQINDDDDSYYYQEDSNYYQDNSEYYYDYNTQESDYFNMSMSSSAKTDQVPFSFYDHLKGECDNIEGPIEYFDHFYNEFLRVSKFKIDFDFKSNPIIDSNCKSKVDSKYFYRIMKVFQRARKHGGLDWWKMFEDGDEKRLLALMKICEAVVSEMNSVTPLSFDDISLLAHIQKLSWNLAVNYDNRMDEDKRIGLKNLNGPRTLQSVLYESAPAVNINSLTVNLRSIQNLLDPNATNIHTLSGNLEHWIIHNIFDPYNYEMFMEVIAEDSDKDSRETFLGPEGFCEADNKSFEIKFPQQNKEIYQKMIENPKVDDLLFNLKHSEYGHQWLHFSHNFAKFLIVFSNGATNLMSVYPQYYKLMNTLSILRIVALGKHVQIDPTKSESYWASPFKPGNALNNHNVSKGFRQVVNYSYLRLLTGSWQNYKSPYENEKTIFYRTRHTLALTPQIDITNVDTWRNYMKTAKTAKLFDSTYFQYLTDHLLNVPKLNFFGQVMFPIDSIDAEKIIVSGKVRN